MATYEIMAPNGKTYQIDGPDGASDDQVREAVLSQYPVAGEAQPAAPSASSQGGRSTGEEVGRALKRTAGMVAGGVGDLAGLVGNPINATINAIAGTNLSTDLGQVARELVGAPDAENTLERITDAIGEGVAGGGGTIGLARKIAPAATGVTSQIAKAIYETPIAELLGGAGAGGAQQITEELGGGPVAQTIAALAGGAAGGIAGGLRDAPALTNPKAVRDYSTPREQRIEEYRTEIQNLLDSGASSDDIRSFIRSQGVDPVFATGIDESVAARAAGEDIGGVRVQGQPSLVEEAANFSPAREPTIEDVFPTPEQEAIRAQALEERLLRDASEFRQATEDVDTVLTSAPKILADDVVDSINSTTTGWKNSPEFEVAQTAADISYPAAKKAMEENPNAKAVLADDGRVYVVADNISDASEIPSIVFHEALGHHGLSVRFRDRLDTTLNQFYNDDGDFRRQVDIWMEQNPGAYTEDANPVARAADEVLAELSEGGQLPVRLMDKIKNEIKDLLRRMGMTDVKYSDREIRTILAMSHDAVINGRGSDVASNGFTGRFMSTSKEGRKKFSTSPEGMRTANDLDDILSFMAENTPRQDSMSISEIDRQAKDIGLNASKYLKQARGPEGEQAAKLRAASNLVVNQMEELQALGSRAETEGLSPSLRATILQKLSVAQAVYARFDGDTSEAGRALRVLREISESQRSASSLVKFMNESGGLDFLGTVDDDTLMRFVKNINTVSATEGPEAAAKFFNNARKLKAEDYAGAVVFNAMLSSPKTWAINFVGTGTNILNEIAVKGLASIGGQFKRVVNSKADRVYGREMVARLEGAGAGLWNYKTFSNIYDSLKTGSDRVGTMDKVGIDKNRAVIEGPLGIIETPRRIMAASDEFWRNIYHTSNMYGEATRAAIQEGLSGRAMRDRVDDIMKNPPAEMLEKVVGDVRSALFRDPPGKYAQKLLEYQTPRYQDEVNIKMVRDPDTGAMTPVSKVVKKANTPAERVAKFYARMKVPFIPTLSNIAKTAVKNAGPFGVLTKSLRDDIKAGGARRDSAMARMAMTSYFAYEIASMAANGDISGMESGDFSKQATLDSVRPSLSVRVGDEWVAYRGLDPFASIISAIATTVERGDSEDIASPENFMHLITGMAAALKENSFAEGMVQTLEQFKDAVDVGTGQKEWSGTLSNAVAGDVSTVIAPNMVRWINQKFLDPKARSTTGEGSLLDRIQGRVASATPQAAADAVSSVTGLDVPGSEDLPIRHDVYGRERPNLRQRIPVETDPTILELDRLERLSENVLIGPVGRTAKVDGVPNVKLNAEQREAYQQLAGFWFVAAMQEVMDTEEWASMSDEEKMVVVRKEKNDARKDAREELFNNQEEE